MPAKKKKGKKKGKKKAKDGELTVDDKYKKTMEEMEALKDHLAIRKEFTRRSQADSAQWKVKMSEAAEELEDQRETQKAVSADMTRQYKTMQTEMGLRMHQLEKDLQKTQTQLLQTQQNLEDMRLEKEKMEKDKDHEIRNLRLKIETMGQQYENILNDSLDKLIEKITGAKEGWEGRSTDIQANNKQTLLEFGLNPLDI